MDPKNWSTLYTCTCMEVYMIGACMHECMYACMYVCVYVDMVWRSTGHDDDDETISER